MANATKDRVKNEVAKATNTYPEIKDIKNDLKSLTSNVGELTRHVKQTGFDDISSAASDTFHKGQETVQAAVGAAARLVVSVCAGLDGRHGGLFHRVNVG